ncbi:ShlB/FhaC/HecB family hemolysin secretion/activation protein [Trinickia diaoshuihuensis]|uniref:ShlB/FhaC/HecB family hemolysin secretion/activation protein n=1 Tax=Trinickia diaoshuihuensis TaxID=2292265 RepID=UPI000E23CC7B|nr:POTRA domain-containing protein [Trinickia diaoshuihuensis]
MITRTNHWLWLAIAATAASPATAQTKASASGNPLEGLPQIQTPRQTPNVSVRIEPKATQLQRLLDTHLTPRAFRIEGVKAVEFAEVARYFSPLAGKDVTIGQLVAAANDVTRLYERHGYALSFAFVPAQTFENGIVRITVVEGYISSVNVKGNPGRTEHKIREIAEHIRNERPLKRASFERYVNALGLLPGVKIAATVQPPTSTDGATSLDLDVERKALNVATGIDFHHPGVQGLVTVTENGLASLGEDISVSALAPKGRDNQTYYAANGALPIGSEGLLAKLNASHYHGNPVDNPGLPAYVKRTVVADKLGLAAAYPLYLSNARSVLGTLSAYASHDENRYENTLTGAAIALRSQVRAVQAQIDYVDTRPGQTRRASFNVAKAFDLLGASKAGETNVPGFVQSNPASLTFVRTGASFSQTNDWPFKLATAIAFTGQYSADSLPTSEQITFGAQRFALGYEPGEASGDSGFGASFELNRAITVGARYMQTFTPYAACDMARVYLHTGTSAPSKLASVALGFRITDNKHYNVDLSIAKAVGDAPIESPSRSPRLNATFSYQLY